MPAIIGQISECSIIMETHQSAMEPLKIIYQDEYLVAIDKPAGLLVHRSMIDRHETQFALQMVRDQIGQHVFPVHRLDRPTSGVLLFALNADIARIIGETFAAGQMEKSYYAIVRGFVGNDAGDDEGCELIIDYPLKEILDKKSDKKARQDKEAQQAVTHLRTMATAQLPYPVGRYESVRYSLLELMPKTGRKHQLRRHMAHIRHPILGDTTHGDGKQNAFFFDHFQLRRLMLIAGSLTLPHPVSQVKLTLKTEFDQSWLLAFEQLGWDVV
ncbi:MAG: tRNA pseudouridine65 synthase [Phenylobacterium sp.]|jgi:tRNA pseudouridine65 synthase